MKNISKLYTSRRYLRTKTHYERLGIKPESSIREVKEAFRTLAKEKHPDISRKSSDDFIYIMEAVQVLSDPNLRQSYDETIGVNNLNSKSENSNSSESSSTSMSDEQLSRAGAGRTNVQYFRNIVGKNFPQSDKERKERMEARRNQVHSVNTVYISIGVSTAAICLWGMGYFALG